MEILEVIEDPDIIFEGTNVEYIAAKEIENGKYLVVIYREVNSEDGFVITAFLTKRKKQLNRRKIICQK